MSARTAVKRLIVCIDAEEYNPETGTLGHENCSNIFRIKSIIPSGLCYDTQGRPFQQTVRYFRAAPDGPSRLERLKNRNATVFYENQIKSIVKEICETLEEAQDELFLYGFGRGAFLVRAIAGLLNTLHLPKSTSLRYFDRLYQSALDVLKAIKEDDNQNGPRILEFLRTHTTQPPRIQFVGLIDTVGYTAEGNVHDISFVPSILNLRHALAFNENSAQLSAEIFGTPTQKELIDRSFIQAWFMGSHQDLGGGAREDGFSLYPLQWLLIESMHAGLALQSQDDVKQPRSKDSPLALAFPQYAGGLPNFEESEKIEWRLAHSNGIQVSLYDLQTLHGNSTDTNQAHNLQINSSNVLYNNPPKVFNSNSKGLIGWCDNGAYGTIIHPSLFCLLDRHSRFYEEYRFKSLKKELADCREKCLEEGAGTVPPWLEGLELQASGVKAFRILVCGKTGVGKSTLINKVFGVEMTEESESYAQGVHDINTAFESTNHPGLLIHDSRGWQAGSDKELDLIAKFLRHRAYQKNPAEALHVIWFCVDSDVSRIEAADKRTFETIAQFSNHVPVFVVGTKKDKLIAFRKIQLLEKYMEQTGNYPESQRLANQEADRMADEQFMSLHEELSKIKHYKADGYCCLSKGKHRDAQYDNEGIKKLLSQTLELITDDRVRLFAVAAQVVDVEQKIDSAITESMRLGTHAVRTAMVPLPFSSAIGTPTVARILCQHVLQCFGFPKALPEAVEEIMTRVVLGHLKKFMVVTMTEFLVVGVATAGLIAGTMGGGLALGFVGSALAVPPTARMLFKCACDMILILERSFRYQGKYVSVKQIEDAAVYYTTALTTTFAGKEVLLQHHVHDQVDKLVPLTKISAGVRFSKLRPGLEAIIYGNRFLKGGIEKVGGIQGDTVPEIGGTEIVELDSSERRAELTGQKTQPVELPTTEEVSRTAPAPTPLAEKEAYSWEGGGSGSIISGAGTEPTRSTTTSTAADDLLDLEEKATISQTLSEQALVMSPTTTRATTLSTSNIVSPMTEGDMERARTNTSGSSGGSGGIFSKGTRKWSSKFGFRKSKTVQE